MFNLKLSTLPVAVRLPVALGLRPVPQPKVKFNNLRFSLRQRVIPNLQMQVTVGDSRVDCRSQMRLKKSRNFLGANL